MSKQNNDIRAQLAALFEEHDYNKRYERLSVVYYMVDGKIEFYQAIKDVPRFTPISDTRVWNKSTYNVITSSEEPTFDNDFMPIYFPPEVGDQIPTYLVDPYDDDVFITQIMAYYVVPNQTTQPEITGIKINNIPYTIVSPKDAEPAPGLAVIEGDTMFMPIDEEMYEEIQYMNQMGVDIDANIGDGLFAVMINALSDTAPSGPITFELNTDVGNCIIVVPKYVKPKQSYIYVVRDDTYSIEFSNYYSYDYNDTQAWASYLESDFGNETTITVSGGSIVCTGWQESSDGETWTDIPNSATDELELTIPEESHYYKPIVVSTDPNWVEISREFDGNYSSCVTDNDDFNTGVCTKSVTITYQDQNQYSSSYNQTRTSTYYTDVEDLVSCPIPQNIVTKQVQVNVWTEYNDNGTIITNDSTKADVNTYINRSLSQIFNPNNIASVPYNGTINALSSDSYFYVDVEVICEPGYCINRFLSRLSTNAQWVEKNPGTWFNNNSNSKRYSEAFAISDSYCDVKVEIVPQIEQTVTIKSIVNFNGVDEFPIDQSIYIRTLDGNIRGYRYHSFNETFTYGLPTGATLLSTPQSDYFRGKEVYEQYVRYSENDSWTQVTPQRYYPLDANHNYFEIKYVVRPNSLQVDVHFATASTVNGQTVYNIDDTLGTLYNAKIGDTQLVGVDDINIGTNTFSNIAYDGYWVSIKAIPSQTSNTPLNTNNIQCLVRHFNQNIGDFNPYSDVSGSIITAQNTESHIMFDIYCYLNTNNSEFHYPNKVEILVVFTPEQ